MPCNIPYQTYIVNLSLMQAYQKLRIDRSRLSVRACRILEENGIADLPQVVGWTPPIPDDSFLTFGYNEEAS